MPHAFAPFISIDTAPPPPPPPPPPPQVFVLSKPKAGELLPGGPEELSHLPDDGGTGDESNTQSARERAPLCPPSEREQMCASLRWLVGSAPVAAPTCEAPRSWDRWR